MQKVFFKTFGCRTNIYDTQVMIAELKDFCIVDSEKDADIVVVNSCTVTNGADSGVRSYINQVSRDNKRVIMAGCGVFNNAQNLQENGKVFGVLGHSKKRDINTLLKSQSPFYELGNLTYVDEKIVTKFHGKSKAFLKIQEGCDFRCSYCIIPYVRGNARSQDEDKILNQIENLAKNGYSEFVLTGTNIGSYGKDKNSSLGKLLQKIGKISGIKRIRLGSIEPVQIDESFREILDESWLERHLHVALQHTNSQMLKIMRRRNNLLKDLELFEFLSSKGFALGTDYIVAHPKESEEIWEDGLRNFKLFPITHLHAFIYSKRDGTPSAKMAQEVKGDIAKQRLREIKEIAMQKNIVFRQNQLSPLRVHVESKKGEFFRGYDQFYNQMHIKSDKNLLKSWIDIENYIIKEEYNEATI